MEALEPLLNTVDSHILYYSSLYLLYARHGQGFSTMLLAVYAMLLFMDDLARET